MIEKPKIPSIPLTFSLFFNVHKLQIGYTRFIHPHLMGGDPVVDRILRNNIFSRLTEPESDSKDWPKDMPKLKEIGFGKNGRLTKTQYEFMQKWSNGIFENDWTGPPSPTAEITPQGLDQVALENAVGGPLYPGIETGGITTCPILEKENYSSLFRFNSAFKQET